MTTSNDLGMPPGVAFLVLFLVVLIIAYGTRAVGRRQRRHSRRGRSELSRVVTAFLDGSCDPHQLLRSVDAADEGTAWTVLESLGLRLDRDEWLRLSAALTRSRHAAAERRALADDSPWRRSLAARRLALVRSRASWRELRRAMTRGPEMVTHAAALALGRYRDRGALRWLLAHPDALGRRPRPVLVATLRAFGARGLPVIADALERGVANARFELAMIDTLGHGVHRPARATLEKRLAGGDIDVRTASARALGLLHAVECATCLIAALKDDAWQVRAQAARALGRVRAPLATTALAARLTDASWWVRHHAAYALRELGEDGQEALRHVVATSPDPYARDMAREALDGGIQRLSA